MKTKLSLRPLIKMQVFLYILCCTLSSARSDTIIIAQYSISKNGKTIGSLSAQSINNEKGRHISLKSVAKTRIVFEIQVVQNTENRISDNYLNESLTERKINGSVSLKHGLKYEQGAYKNIGSEKAQGALPEKITFTTSMLYFIEPQGVKMVYSELQKKMVPLERKDIHIYRLKIGENEYSDYYYQNGELKKVVATSFIGTMVFARETSADNGLSKQ